MTELDRLHHQRLAAMDYHLFEHLFERPRLKLKPIDAEEGLFKPCPVPRQRWWIRLKRELPENPFLHMAVLAHLPDWRAKPLAAQTNPCEWETAFYRGEPPCKFRPKACCR